MNQARYPAWEAFDKVHEQAPSLSTCSIVLYYSGLVCGDFRTKRGGGGDAQALAKCQSRVCTSDASDGQESADHQSTEVRDQDGTVACGLCHPFMNLSAGLGIFYGFSNAKNES
jgi:hypothetical protein